jgi:hypothetical protein
MDFNLDNLLNLPNVTVFSYSTQLEFIIVNLHFYQEFLKIPLPSKTVLYPQLSRPDITR